MTLYKYIVATCIVLLLGAAGTVAAQNVTVKGKLVDEKTNTALADVTVRAGKNTTESDIDGKFTIEVKVGSQITFSQVGYVEKKWKVKDTVSDNITITLASKDHSGDEVVVQSFKQVKKTTVTGASTVIDGKTLQDQPVSNAMQLLQGKVAGLNVQMTTGSPGAAPSINLRGVATTTVTASGNLSPTSPLFIIDGVPVDVNTNYQYGFESGGSGISPLALIPPEDIESIEVLKDAAMTSQYGSKATYGVIIVTTRRGQSKVPIVAYSTSFFYNTPPKLRPTIGGQQERQIRLNTILNFDTASHAASLAFLSQYPFLSDSLNPYWNNSTDWQSYFYRSTSNQSHNIQVSGGDRVFNYKTNLNYYNEKGIVVNTGLQRYTLNLSGIYNPTSQFYVMVNLQEAMAYKQNGSGEGLLQSAIATSANASSLAPPPSLFSNAAALEASKAKNDGKINNFSGSMNLQYEPIKGLRFQDVLAYSFTTNTSDYVKTAYLARDSAGVFAYNDRSYNINNRAQISYTKVVNNVHNFYSYLFNEITKNGYRANMIYFNGPADAQITGPLGNSYMLSAGGTLSSILEQRQVGYGGDFTYNYADRYIIDVSYRLDNSSSNGPSKGYITAPALSMRWNFYKEKFSEKASWLSLGAVRASWGRTTKPNGTVFDAYGKYTYGPRYNDGQTVMLDFTTIPNTSFEPEVATTTNLGLDLGFLNNRITASIDAYYKTYDNQLVKDPLAGSSGFVNKNFSQQSLVNRGIELTTNFNIIQQSKFRWSVGLNGSFVESVLAHLPNGVRSITESVQDAYGSYVPVVHQVGGIPTSNLLYVTKGVYAKTSDVPVNPATGLRLQYGRGSGLFFQAGDPIWQDINGDYIIDNATTNNADMVAVGNPTPKLVGGLTTQVVYKEFTLNVNTSLTAYRDILNLVAANNFAAYGYPQNANALVPIDGFNYWKPTNSARTEGTVGAQYPNPFDFRRTAALNPFRVNQTLFLENGTYFKINTIMLSYNVARELLKRYKMNSLRMTLTCQNPFVFTKYSGVSAEQVSTLGRDISGGYPLARTYSLSLSVQF